MCRPLRAVMVGHRYAIIVPEVRGIRRAPRGSVALSLVLFLLFPFLTRERTLTRVREDPLCRVSSHPDGVLLASTALPYARSSRLTAQLHSNRSKSVAVRCRHMHSHCHTRKQVEKRPRSSPLELLRVVVTGALAKHGCERKCARSFRTPVTPIVLVEEETMRSGVLLGEEGARELCPAHRSVTSRGEKK